MAFNQKKNNQYAQSAPAVNRQGNGGSKKQSNTGNDEEKVRIHWDQPCFVNGGELIDSVFITSGTIKYAKVVNINNKDAVSIQLVSVIGDKLVGEVFGQEYVNEQHEVTFNFLLNGYDAEHFMTDRRPRWGQTIDVTLIHLVKNAYTDKQGVLRRDISAWLAPKGFRVFGSRYGNNGQERKIIQLHGYDERSGDENEGDRSSYPSRQGNSNSRPTGNSRTNGGYQPQFYREEDDEEQPF